MPSHQNSQKSQNSKIQYPLHKNIILDDKSMNSLEPKTWLEDEVVGSYFLHLHNKLIRKNGGFSDMIVLTHIFNENIRSMKGKITKAKLQEYCLQLKNEPINKYYNYILLPIILHDNKKIGVSNGNHYFGVLIDFQNRDFIIYDSFTSHSHKKDIPFIHKILQILGLENDDKPFGHSVVHKPRQTNPLDCGVFVCFWARALMFFDSDESREFLSKDTLSKTELNQMREHIRQELEQYHRKDKKPSPVHSSDVELLESPKTSQKLSQKLSESSSSFPSSIPLSSTLSSLSPSESPKSSQKSQIHKNITITGSDVNSLQENKKLTDNTVYSYIQHLENEAQKIKRKENILILKPLSSINPSLLKKSKLLLKDLKSIDTRLTKLKDLKRDYSFILFPMVVENNWILIQIDLKYESIVIFNSLKSTYKKVENKIHDILKTLGADFSWKVYYEGPYQDNKFDDGVFVSYHARNIILDDNVEFSQSDIPIFRKQMLDILMNYHVPSPKKSQTPQISPLSSSQSQSPVPYDVQKEMFPNINPLAANNDSTAIPTSYHKLSDFYKEDLKNPFPKAKHPENAYIKMPNGELVKSKFHTMEGTGLQPINMNNYIDQEVMEQYSSLLKCFGKKVKQIGKVKILSPGIYDFITGVHPQSRFYFKGMEKNDIITSLSHDNMEMKISEFDMVLWPIYHNLEHWILFVIRYKKGIIEFFDSTPFYDYPEVFLDIKKFIFAQNLKKKLKIKYLSSPSQKNWHDCGVFTMEVMMNLLHEGQMTWEEKNIPEIRIRIKEELKTCRLVDGFKITVFPKKDDKKKIRQNKNI